MGAGHSKRRIIEKFWTMTKDEHQELKAMTSITKNSQCHYSIELLQGRI